MAQSVEKPTSPYNRRISRALAKGHSRSQARGHPKSGEKHASGRTPTADTRLTEAVQKVKAGETLTAAAKAAHVSRERLRQAISEQGDYVRQGGRHRFVARRRNDLPLYSGGQTLRVVVDDANAAKLGAFMAAVRSFLRSQKLGLLTPFAGGGVTDTTGQFHPFETDPEELYRLDTKGRAVFHQIYQLSN
jgi:hypothetical protein